jgi:hypothetical protein
VRKTNRWAPWGSATYALLFPSATAFLAPTTVSPAATIVLLTVLSNPRNRQPRGLAGCGVNQPRTGDIVDVVETGARIEPA